MDGLLSYHFPNSATSMQLISVCRGLFSSDGVAEEFSSYGGSQFIYEECKEFLKTLGVSQRLSSVDYPQSNGKADNSVKSSKRIIMSNARPNGSLYTDKFSKAILQYRNTPFPDLGLSPAQLLFHRQLRVP